MVAATVAALVATGCSSSEEPEPQAEVRTVVTVIKEVAAEPVDSRSTTEREAPTQDRKREGEHSDQEDAPVGKLRVPDVVGEDHQLAQDTMQASGLYNLAEEDATGQGRMLLFDRNWTVVSQSPAPGTMVSEDRTITLRSKKDGE
jgi:hypothetical protein